MAQLLVRNLDDDVKRRLRERAVRRGRSMEEEVREILLVASQEDVAPSEPLSQRIAQRFSELGLSGELFEIPEMRGQPVRPAKFRR